MLSAQTSEQSNMHRGIVGGILLAWVLGFSPATLLGFDKDLDPFLEAHCYECHDDAVAKGGLDMFALGTDLQDPAVMAKWVRIYDRVQNGEMPPKEQPRPRTSEIAAFAKTLSAPLTAAHEAEKGTVLRRLNRQEYENTLNDLFGTNIDLAGMLPEDGRSHEFDNVGEALNISMVQMQRYLEGIEAVLDEAVVHTIAKPEAKVKKASYATSKDSQKFIGSKWLRRDDGAVVFFNQTGYPSGTLKEASADADGYYKVRITGYAYQSDKPISFVVNGDTYLRGAPKPTYGYFSLPPGKPTTIEFETWIPRRYMIQIKAEGISDNYQLKNTKPKDYKGPGLAIQSIELEGPIVREYPSSGHQLIYAGLDRPEIMPKLLHHRERNGYVPRFELQSTDPEQDIRPVLQRVATAAFRRPIEASDIDPYLELYRTEIEQGSEPDTALQTAVKAIFCSPRFLYLQEPTGELDDYALAARLSYGFVRTAPDADLRELAAQGKLKGDPAALIRVTRALLDDPRSERFIVDFTDAWLNLRDMEFTSPDGILFPEFDSYLKYSMVEETRAYFRQLISANRPVGNLVKSNFAMLNERLAEHYEIPNVTGPEVRLVSLPADSARGGFLSQGSVLKVSANGTNTSPVVRGVWVMERILGVTPPPPPPGIPGVEPDIRGAETLRELLDKHRDSVSCKSCHEQIDPPGFALEAFNPIGGERTFFRSLGEGEKINVDAQGNRVRYRKGPPVDASGVLSGKGEFAGYREFRDLLAEDEAALAKAFATKMLIFLTGREMGFSDRPEIERIVAENAKSGYGVKDLIEQCVASPIFRSK